MPIPLKLNDETDLFKNFIDFLEIGMKWFLDENEKHAIVNIFQKCRITSLLSGIFI